MNADHFIKRLFMNRLPQWYQGPTVRYDARDHLMSTRAFAVVRKIFTPIDMWYGKTRTNSTA